MRHGDLPGAQRDVAAAAKLYAKDPEWSERFRVLQAHVAFQRGDYQGALDLLKPELPPALAGKDVAVHRLMVQALANEYLQNYQTCEAILSAAERLDAQLASAYGADLAQTRGILEIDLGHYDRAETAFHRALTYAQAHHQPYAELNALGNLGNVAMKQEHYDQAIDLYRRDLGKATELNAKGHIARLHGNIGWNYSVVGDLDNAAGEFSEAYHASKNAGLADDTAYWLCSQSGIELQQRNYENADKDSREAVELAKKQQNLQTRRECLNTRSEILLVIGKLDEAARANAEARDVKSENTDQTVVNASDLLAGRIALARGDYGQAAQDFQRVLDDSQALTPQKWEAHARLAEVYAARNEAAGAQREFEGALATIENAWCNVEEPSFQLSFRTSAIAFYQSYIDFLISQKRPQDALAVAERGRTQALSHQCGKVAGSAARVDARQTARRLHAALLFYSLGERRSHLWAITGDDTAVFELPASREIADAIKKYRDSFLQPRDPLLSGNADAQALYAMLVQPAEKLLANNPRVFVLPDDALNAMNLEALIVPGDHPHYWIEDVTLLTAHSLTQLAHSKLTPAPQAGDMLMVGDVEQASQDFPKLPQADRELGLVGKYFAKERLTQLTKKDATPSRWLASQPERFAYLHFTTHGTASRQWPLESAVILSPEGDSFKLYARDIVRHPLHAYLVTISACNGAGVKTYAGEGLVGLSWAFLHAGARQVIAGLWEVNATSTPQLMDELYKQMRAGDDPATALRKAKLSLIHGAAETYRRPLYWAPFQLYLGS